MLQYWRRPTLVYPVVNIDTFAAMNNSPISKFVEQQGVLLLDGGLATELEHRGHDLKHALWSARLLASQPGEITAVHLEYLRAGANCLVTSSYQATIQGLEQQGLSRRRSEMMLASTISLAVAARDQLEIEVACRDLGSPAPLIAASVGPYGAFLADGSEYSGHYGLSRQQLRDFHEPRWAVLDDSVADLIACETIPSLVEAQALIDLLEQSEDRTAWISFTCADAQSICDGTPLEECAKLVAECKQMVAVGINCLAPDLVLPIVRKLHSWLPGKFIIAYPNSGETYDPQGRCWMGNAHTADFGKMALAWRDAGATIIGGCCRTGPAHIAKLKEVLR
jgi:homocysteine S-methyltransferase